MFARALLIASLIAAIGCGGEAVPKDVDAGTTTKDDAGDVVVDGGHDEHDAGPADAGDQFDEPQPPTNVIATADDARAIVKWKEPSNTGGKPILSYTVITMPGGIHTIVESTLTAITGLTNGRSYSFTVIATNEVGDSVSSESSNAIVPSPVPGKPTNVVATRGNGKATVSWMAPTPVPSPVKSYSVIVSPGGALKTTTETSIEIGGLLNGISYTFTVFATNAIGNGPESDPSAAVTPADVPKPPTILMVLAEHGEAWVTWSPPDDNGSPIAGYTVFASPGDIEVTAAADATSADVTGLTNGTRYTFTVVATNDVGDSIPSLSHFATPTSFPSEPLNVTAVRGNAKATVSWTAPLTDGGTPITSFGVTTYPGATTQLFTGTAPSAVIGNLANGTSYTFRVYSINAKGQSSYSEESNTVVPAAAPDAPANVSASRGDTQATVSWSAPADNGEAITAYVITTSPGGVETNVSGTTLQAAISNLTNGQSYTFTVKAINAIGASVSSPPSNFVTPAGVPAMPTNVTATRGNNQATVSWAAPSSNGSAILRYVVAANGSNPTQVPTNVTSYDVIGLSNGVSYTFTVWAANDVGDSVHSDPSNAVTPAGVPGMPKNLLGTAGDQQVSLTWSAPDDNGGDGIVEYTVTTEPSGPSVTVDGTTFAATVTGLTNGLPYQFRVTAKNSVGAGSPSVYTQQYFPFGVPTPPLNVSALRGNASADVFWNAPADTNGDAIQNYIVYSTPADVAPIEVSGSTFSTKVPGLMNGRSYTFAVKARNKAGESALSLPSSSVVPARAPDAPTKVVAALGDKLITVAWTPPTDNGGSAITGYILQATPGGAYSMAPAGATTGSISGLSNGTAYTIKVYASNAVGTGEGSVASNEVTPAAVPGTPTISSAVAGNAQVTLSWTVPASNGAAISGYTIVASTGTTYDALASDTSKTISGLTNGTSYTFRIRARNAAGDGPLSASTSAVTPATVPDAPTQVKASSDNTKSYVTWKVPANGGSAITGYTVTAAPGDIVVNVSGASASQTAFSGLSSGPSVAYNFTVVAKNAIGSSSPASSNLLPRPCGSISFALRGSYNAAYAPTDVAFGDFNVDGYLDVAIAHSSWNTVSIMLNNGDGSFGAATSVTTLGGPTIIGVGDLNNDGKPDIAVSNTLVGSVSVLTNNGTGGFSVTSTASVVSKVSNGTVGDVNGDGWLDLIVGTRGSGANTIAVMVNNKNGTFGTFTLLTGNYSPDALRLGDLDGDNILDLVVGHYGAAEVKVFHGKGTGYFDPPVTLSGPGGTNNVALVDLNGDAKLDIVADSEFSPGGFTTWVNHGTGTFPTTGTVTNQASASVRGSDAADFNGDGWIDGFGGMNTGAFSTFYGVGDGTLRAPSSIASTTDAHAFAVADFNNDGRPDFIVNTASSTAGMSVYLNTCDP